MTVWCGGRSVWYMYVSVYTIHPPQYGRWQYPRLGISAGRGLVRLAWLLSCRLFISSNYSDKNLLVTPAQRDTQPRWCRSPRPSCATWRATSSTSRHSPARDRPSRWPDCQSYWVSLSRHVSWKLLSNLPVGKWRKVKRAAKTPLCYYYSRFVLQFLAK